MVGSFESDTIAALSTPWGRGGIAVIRISGEKTRPILEKVIEACPTLLTPRKAYHRFITSGTQRIDEGVVVFYKAPHSYTGEDAAEISLHSNPFLVEEVLNIICQVEGKGIRPALPGEFTYRAFKNGKMDLLQAESVNELIDANSRYYAHMQFGALEGRLSHFMKELKQELIDLAVHLETKIEFEEDQLLFEILEPLENREQQDREPWESPGSREISPVPPLEALLKRMETLLSNARFNELLNKGLTVVIVGKVNVGKSSLFNTLLMEERSITSPTPGTTRDFIREKIYIEGFPIEITDVAGINRETKDEIEAQGIRRSLEKIENGDAVIFMLDASSPLDHNDKEIYRLIKDKKKLLVMNKMDIEDQRVWDAAAAYFKGEEMTPISIKTHFNIEAVHGFLKGMIGDVRARETEFTINQRQKLALEELKAVLTGVKEMAEGQSPHIELMAEELRRALGIIGRLMGEITPDDILNQIFSQFCLGK